MSKALNYRRILRAADLSLRVAGGAVLAAVLAGCHEDKTPAPPAVVVAQPVHADEAGGVAPLRFPAEAAPRYANSMSFRVAGNVVERKVRIGDIVKKGEVVARLDAVDAEKQLASAQAALAAADHRLLFAKQQLDRDTAQAAGNLIAANQLEQSQDAYVAAKSARDQAAAQLVVAEDTLGYHSLVADHDGVIAGERADTGQVVAAGQPVYDLAWTGEVDAVIDVGANDVARISVGQPAQISFLAVPGLQYKARVREVAAAADPLSRTYRVKLSLSEPGPSIRLGMTGEAILSPSGEAPAGAAFRVPATAIFHSGSAPAVFVVRPGDSVLELRPVTVLDHGARLSAVAGELKDGDMVVLAGVHTVYAGEKVTPVAPLFDRDGDVAGPAQGKPRSE